MDSSSKTKGVAVQAGNPSGTFAAKTSEGMNVVLMIETSQDTCRQSLLHKEKQKANPNDWVSLSLPLEGLEPSTL